MKIVNKELLDMDDNPMKSGEVNLTVAEVLMNAALAPPENPNVPRKSKEVIERYDLALMLRKVGLNESFDLTVEQAADLQKDVLRMYATIVTGQILKALDPKPVAH